MVTNAATVTVTFEHICSHCIPRSWIIAIFHAQILSRISMPMHAERDNCYGKYVCLSVSIVVESKSESESSGSESESKSESKSSWLISN